MSKELKYLACIVTALCLCGCSSQTGTLVAKNNKVDWELIAEENHVVRWSNVASIYDSLEGKPVLRIETDLAVIRVSMDDVISHLQAQSSRFLVDLAAKMSGKYSTPREYDWDELSAPERFQLYFHVPFLLEQGRFVIQRKDTHETVREIVVGEYQDRPTPLSGTTGTIFFFTDGGEFYTAVMGVQ